MNVLSEKGYVDHSMAWTTNGQYLDKAANKAGRALGKVVFGAAINMVLEGSALSLLSSLL